MKSCCRMAWAEYKRWLANPRIVLLLMLIVYARESVGKVMCQHSVDMGMNLQLFEPYIALCNSYIVVLITPIIFLVMMADFPVMEGSYMWCVYRMGKREWVFSQLILSFLCGITIEVGLLITSIISCIGHITMQSNWSEVITRYYLYFPEKSGSEVSKLISGDIYNQMSPTAGFLYTITLSHLSMILYSVVLMCGKIYGKRYFSYGICIGLIGIGAAARLLDINVKWFFPSANSSVSGHFEEYVRHARIPLYGSYIYFIAAIIVIVLICMIGMKRRNICRKL